MGRPIGSLNRQKPFTDALRVALLSGGGRRLRVIAEKLAEKAEQTTSTPSNRSRTGWTVNARRRSSAAMSRWKSCPTKNCSRSFGGNGLYPSFTIPVVR